MRKYKIIFSPHALNDIEAACVYYDKQQKNLSKRFVKQILVTIEKIKQNPFYASVRYDNVRCAIVPRFPFLIHYTVEEKTITIAAVYNTHQEPLW